MIKLAQKDEHFKGKLAADQQLATLGHQADVFLASMAEARKQQENSLYQEELRIKEKTGSGI
jgi:hypothetical protein